jgi:branched-chain amino acid transport system ATP-binding protein
VTGIVPSSQGRILFDGRDITALPSHHRVRVGIAQCAEGRKLFAGLTVRENLDLGAFGAPAQVRRDRRERIVDRLPALKDRLDQVATTMSGGQQQLVAIGRALMSDPKLVLCDEVTLGLSPKAADDIYDAILAVADLGGALVLVEQNVDRCLALANRAYVLAHGRIVLEAPAGELDRDSLAAAYLGSADSP